MAVPFKIDRRAEAERIERNVAALTPDPETAARVFRNSIRMMERQWRRADNWVVAMHLYGVGSTYAFAICRRIRIDPEAVAGRPTPAQIRDLEGGER